MRSRVERMLWILIFIALALGFLGSLAIILFRDFLSRYASSWG